MYKSSSYRPQYYRGSHSEQNEQETPEPFFTHQQIKQEPGKNGAFFQPKLSVGPANDQYEQQADAVADKVANRNSPGPVIQQKEISSVQRLATSKEDERQGTNDARMLKDKEIQEKPELQRKCAECKAEEETVQKKSEPRPEEKEKKPPAKPVTEKKEKAPGKDGKAAPEMKDKKAAPEKKEEKDKVQKKSESSSSSVAPASVSQSIRSSAGKGNPLPAATLADMQSAFQTDFRQVKIHIDAEAQNLNKDLHAQAFTHGRDIYFNMGKFDPATRAGKKLLAHELTHVVQQGAASSGKKEPGELQAYRPKSDFNFGRKDTQDLKEDSFDKRKDTTDKPWIEQINIHFNQIAPDVDGAWMPKGSLVALYNMNRAAPGIVPLLLVPNMIVLPITGGKHTELYTHPGTHTVTRIKGAGYDNTTDKSHEGPNKRYAKDLNSNMSFAIFFHNGEAIHSGALDIGSHGCVHVDWGGDFDTGDTDQLQRLNYHTVKGLTKVVVTYDPAILPFLCCRRYEHKKKTKSTGDKPCDKVKAQTC